MVDYVTIILKIGMVKKNIFALDSQFLIGYGWFFDVFYKFLLE